MFYLYLCYEITERNASLFNVSHDYETQKGEFHLIMMEFPSENL